MGAVGYRLRGEVGAVVERSEAGRALDAASFDGTAWRRKIEGAAQFRRCGSARRTWDRLVRLALISDIHANLEALQATLADISTQGVDRIVCLGDIVGYNAKPAECLALIRAGNILCVAGNHDLAVGGQATTEDFSPAAVRSTAWTRQRLAPGDLAFLGSLPRKANIGDALIAVHGALHPETGCESVRLDNEERRIRSFRALATHPSGARICAFGHTHQAAVYEYRGERAVLRPEPDVQLRPDDYYLINPGTVGEPRSRDRRASYMVLDLEARTVALRRVEYDASVPFIAAREAELAPRLGLARLASKLRSLIEI
jgi:predicted phosphodiesterase